MIDRLAIGTAQFGLDYGIANARGRVPEAEVAAILADASARGVDLLDTAPAYGEAEAVLGRLPEAGGFRIATKTERLAEAGVEGVVVAARASVATLRNVDALLVHAASDLAGPDGPALWAALQKLKAEGAVRRIGISAYAEEDPVALARRWRPEVVQVPVSLLDQRLVRDGSVERLAEAGVEVHARSLFLQGLLLLDPARLPAGLRSAEPHLVRCREMAGEGGLLAAALAFALGRRGVAKGIVGVASLAEWHGIAAAAARPEPELDWDAFALDDPAILDPRRW